MRGCRWCYMEYNTLKSPSKQSLCTHERSGLIPCAALRLAKKAESKHAGPLVSVTRPTEAGVGPKLGRPPAMTSTTRPSRRLLPRGRGPGHDISVFGEEAIMCNVEYVYTIPARSYIHLEPFGTAPETVRCHTNRPVDQRPTIRNN